MFGEKNLFRNHFFNVVLSQNSIFFKYIFNQLFPRNRFNCFQGEEEGAKENRFYSLCVWLDHDVAVDEDGADDRAGEEGVGEHVDGDPVSGSGSGSLTMLGAYLLIG